MSCFSSDEYWIKCKTSSWSNPEIKISPVSSDSKPTDGMKWDQGSSTNLYFIENVYLIKKMTISSKVAQHSTWHPAAISQTLICPSSIIEVLVQIDILDFKLKKWDLNTEWDNFEDNTIFALKEILNLENQSYNCQTSMAVQFCLKAERGTSATPA